MNDDAEEKSVEEEVFGRLKAALPELKTLLDEVNGHWGYEDGIYRYYHQSFKVYGLQRFTTRIVEALQALAPDEELNRTFLELYARGTGIQFEREHNRRWREVTGPIVEAFLHAKFFLEMAVKYGEKLEEPPTMLPSGWAAFLYLFNLR